MTESKTLLTIKNYESTVHTFTHIFLSYLMLKYSIGIHNIEFTPSQIENVGTLTISSDGMLMFKATTINDWNNWNSKFIVEYLLKPYTKPKVLEFNAIKRILINDLKIDIKQ